MVNAIDSGDAPQPAIVFNWANMNINEIKQIMIMCPATMLAKRRIISAMGFIKRLRISTGTKMNFIPRGTPGGLKICPQ